MNPTPIRVMIVDDSLLQRAALRQILEADPRFKVVATAEDGEKALMKAKWLDIDVITLDIEMPVLNGLDTLKALMKTKPIPVVMISLLTKQGAKETLQALALGAVSFVEKPPIGKNITLAQEEIRTRVYEASLVNLATFEHRLIVPPPPAPKPFGKQVLDSAGIQNLLAIGTSTGGPAALATVLPQLPKGFPAAVVVVQHMPAGSFIKDLAAILSQSCAFSVKEAVNGEAIEEGTVYIAPGGFHLELFKRSGKLHTVLTQMDFDAQFMPSVDVLFASIARLALDSHICGAILTGMGNDGVKGAHAFRRRDFSILAESEETAVIYGMPRRVAEEGLVDALLPLPDIVPEFLRRCTRP